MLYTVDIIIDKPLREVVDLFNNEDNLYKWMRGLQSMEHLEGTPGKEGAKTRLQFQMGKRHFDMEETILSMNPPEEMTTEYRTKGVYNKVITRFEEAEEGKTRYISEQDFRFSGFMKYLAPLMKGAFKKQSSQYLKDFKEFAETSGVSQG